MRGLLTDVNIQGFLPTAELLMAEQGYAEVLKALGVGFFKFPDFGLPRDCNDRSLWNFCQALGLALLTDNRNHDGADSLQAALHDSLREDSLPVLTPGDKGRL